MAESGLKASLATTFQRAGKAQKLVTLLLLFILITAATASVSAVLTGPNWAFLWESLFLGLLVGWLLAIFRVSAWKSAVIVVILGAFFCILIAAGLNEKILAVFEELIKLAGNAITALKLKGLDITPLESAVLEGADALGVVASRVSTWLRDLVSGQANFDPVAAGVVWSFAVWLVAAWAGWVVEATKNALLAALPAVLMCLSTLSYAQSVSTTIYVLLGLTLVLVAIVQYDHREQVWTETKVAYPARKGREIGNVSLVITVFLLFIAAVLSSISIQSIIRRTAQRRGTTSQSESGLAKSLGIKPGATPTPDTFTNIRSPGLPRELLIGSGPELSSELVMSIKISDLTPFAVDGLLAPLYWRSFTYDNYTGHGWSSSVTQPSQYNPGQPIQPGQLPGHLLIEEQVGLLPGAEGYIYAAGEPVTANVSTIAAWRSYKDLFGIQASSNVYIVQSLVSAVDESTLRSAGQAYPLWVSQRYLALPTEVPARVRELAIQLTAAEPTPYDRARAIEQYLRTNYPYTLDLPRPPAIQDLVDYFLFDLRKGYCDYYASAMVVLSRAAGIPARLATGYASGTYNEKTKRFIVSQAEAHSWAEVYFPGVGWVPFEPTAGLPAIIRPGQSTPSVVPSPTPFSAPPTGSSNLSFGKYTGWIILSTLGVLGFAWILWNEIRLSRQKPHQQATEIYRRLKRYAALLRVPTESGDTPYELGDRFKRRITEISNTSRVSLVESITLERIEALIDGIVQLSYQAGITGPTSSASLVHQWNYLRWSLRLVWVVSQGEALLYLLRTMNAVDQNEKPAQTG